MPLADKIIQLRKKQGWSQIDLADRLDVSRQSVSKWEMAQAVPELDKIIKMSELFAVTTDYLLKDEGPGPDSAGSAPPPPPETGPSAPDPAPEEAPVPPEPEKPRRRRWPWVLAACLVLALSVNWLLAAAGVLAYLDLGAASSTTANLADDTVIEQPAGLSAEQTAVSDPDAPEDGMTEYTYEGGAMTAGGIDPAELEAIAGEYAPYGITYAYDGGRCQWYLDGQPIRVFTDVLTSNGKSLTGGDFQGVLRNYAGQGDIDVRTVRDFDHCDEHGSCALLYVEVCDIRHEGAQWVEHHAEEHHAEEHHD